MNRKVRSSGALVTGVLAAGAVLLPSDAAAVAGAGDVTGTSPVADASGPEDAPLGVPVAGTVRAAVDGVTKLVSR